jgi:outer membrane receptor protein involved in Fe transport
MCSPYGFPLARLFANPPLNTSLHIKNVRAEAAFPAFETFFDDAVGNPNLNNESVTTLELGYRGRFFDDALSTEAVLFYNRYRDTIVFHIDIPTNEFGLPSLSRGVIQFQNAGREVDSLGGSLSLNWRMLRRVLVGANYTYRYSWYTSDPFDMAGTEAGEKGDRVEWEPAHLINFFGHYLFDFGLRMGLSWHGVSAHTGYISSGGAFDPRLAIEVPKNHMFGAFISFRADRERASFEVGVRVFDLFNNPYRDLAGESKTSPGALGGELMGRRVVVFVRGAY